LKAVGERYKGKYILTAVTHRYGLSGYSTNFRASGLREQSLSALLSTREQQAGNLGVVVAVVTDNKDDQNLGRVKVKYPWLDQGREQSDWVRVASMGAGSKRGGSFIPEVNDEVLVAFEHGDMRSPFIIGGLWNGQDKPPEPKIKDGKVVERTITSRNGHVLTFSDEDGSGKGFILIKTADGKQIKLTDTDKGIEIKTDKHTVKLDDQGSVLSLESQGDLKIKSQKKISIEGQMGVEMKSSQKVSIEGQAGAEMKTSASLDLQGSLAKVQASGVLTIQGSLVKIN
jgi:uncharacterized protein involved in type VI secretion and phage assembly